MLAVVVSDRPMAAPTTSIINGWRVSVTRHDLASWPGDATRALSMDECARFDAMTAPGAADLRRAAHVLKREAVGARLGLPPAVVAFARDTRRPTLLAPHADTHVSLSHTRGGVAVVTAGAPVGIDIEPIDHRGDPTRLAARYFAGDEARVIAAAPSDERGFAFVWRWVAKEALLKCRGLTLGAALGTPLGDGPCRVGELPFSFEARDARITVFAPAPAFVCAVAG